jgi:transcriptional regulator with XRE-family HTH domain
MKDIEPIARWRVRNRILAVMAHTSRYSIRGQARLAEDARVSRSTVCRFLSGEANPSFALVMAITQALETRLGRPVDPRELVSMDGTFPTASVCELCGCRGCLPPEAYAPDDTLRQEYRGARPGEWLADLTVRPIGPAPDDTS